MVMRLNGIRERGKMNSEYDVGDVVEISIPDKRCWRKIWFKLARKGTPMYFKRFTVTEVTETTFSVDRPIISQ